MRNSLSPTAFLKKRKTHSSAMHFSQPASTGIFRKGDSRREILSMGKELFPSSKPNPWVKSRCLHRRSPKHLRRKSKGKEFLAASRTKSIKLLDLKGKGF